MRKVQPLLPTQSTKANEGKCKLQKKVEKQSTKNTVSF
jgi:hypothetical protein